MYIHGAGDVGQVPRVKGALQQLRSAMGTFTLLRYLSEFFLSICTCPVESTEGVLQILPRREFLRWAPSPFGVTVSFT